MKTTQILALALIGGALVIFMTSGRGASVPSEVASDDDEQLGPSGILNGGAKGNPKRTRSQKAGIGLSVIGGALSGIGNALGTNTGGGGSTGG